MSETSVEAVLRELCVPGARVSQLLSAYQAAEDRPLWEESPALYRAFGRRLIMTGHPTGAFELLREGLMHFPDDPELLYLRALALARGGNMAKAWDYAAELLRRSDLDQNLRVEALSLAGRVLKDRYQQTGDPVRKAALALESARHYLQAYQVESGWYPGINAATMFLLAGEPERARQLARAVLASARSDAERAGPEADHWLLATLREVSLLLGQEGEAASWYHRAVCRADGLAGDVAAIRRQIQLLEERLSIGQEVLALFRTGPVVVFAGHMIDLPTHLGNDRGSLRFPPDPALEAQVREALRAELDRLQPVAGYCSGACGSDLLFAELMVERGEELHLVQPFAREDFYTSSVDFGLAEMADYRRRFDALLACKDVQVHQGTEEKFLGDDILFDFVSTFAQGLGLLRAAELGAEAMGLVVLDQASPPLVGGTVHFLKTWSQRGQSFRLIDLAALRNRVAPQPPAWWRDAAPVPSHPARRLRRELKVMLFADVNNYSRLREEQAPAFFVAFLGQVQEVVQAIENGPVFCNTWGDGLFLVFNEAASAADFALRLLDRMHSMDWGKVDLPSDTTVRIGMHVGPVYPHWDQVIGRQNFFGTHVNRAARIEPVTMPGCVYTSEQFAALLAVEPDHDFVCAYLGAETLGKAHDRFHCVLYRLMRQSVA